VIGKLAYGGRRENELQAGGVSSENTSLKISKKNNGRKVLPNDRKCAQARDQNLPYNRGSAATTGIRARKWKKTSNEPLKRPNTYSFVGLIFGND